MLFDSPLYAMEMAISGKWGNYHLFIFNTHAPPCRYCEGLQHCRPTRYRIATHDTSVFVLQASGSPWTYVL